MLDKNTVNNIIRMVNATIREELLRFARGSGGMGAPIRYDDVAGGVGGAGPHPLDPDAGPHTGTLTEDDVVFADGGHAHSGGAGGQKVTAANVINVPAGGIIATDVQAALNELDTKKAGINDAETIGASWIWSGANEVQFRQVTEKIYSGDADYLDLAAATAIRLNAQALISDGTYALPGLAFISDPDTGLYRIGADQLGFATGGAFAMVITANQYVGINTIAPASAILEVQGIANLNACLIWGDNTSGQSYGLAVAAGTTDADYAMRVTNQAVTAEYLYVRGDGNIGVRTATPAVTLHVYSSNVGAVDYCFRLGENAGAGNSYADFGFQDVGNGLLAIGVSKAGVGYGNISLGPDGGNVGINTSSPGAQLHLKDGSGAWIQASLARLKMSDVASSISWRMDDSGNLQALDNVDAALVQITQIGGIISYGAQAIPQQAGIMIDRADFPQLIFNATGGAANEKIWRIIGRSGTDFEIQTLNDAFAGEVDAMRIYRTGTSIVYVLFPNGNLGINTATPGVKLHVVGSIRIDGDEGGAANTLTLTDTVSAPSGVLQKNLVTPPTHPLADEVVDYWIKVYVGTTVGYVPWFQAA